MEPQLGTERFVVRRRLGAGGMGAVYEAFDNHRGGVVALKTLHKLEPASLYRFKQEFRALADVSHPNLVALYELIATDELWFFTMECIEGVGFLEHVRAVDEAQSVPGSAPGVVRPAPTPTQTLVTVPGRELPEPADQPAPRADLERLRPALRGLAVGVATLHQSGHLHRDIKPSNVMVTAEGRVVLMDFGVVVESSGGAMAIDDFVGTPAYMAPEQIRSEPTEASDWYSVGIMLFEALTGERPFRGSVDGILSAKQNSEPPAPHVLNPDVPADLDRLCHRLLRRDPAQRPSAAEVLQLVGAVDRRVPRRAAAEATGDAEARPALIGRDAEMEVLRRAYADARQGHGSTVFVHGMSGMGKSALVQAFVDEVQRDPQAIVLAGKCYEQEAVPYKAVDGVVDALTRHLIGLPRADADMVLPRDVHSVAKMFPVLQRAEAIAAARRRSKVAVDPQELRRRSFAALRELLSRLAELRPLVIAIDDLQWGDADSAPLLADLMQPPNMPPMLLVCSYRSEDADTSPILRALLRRDARLGISAQSHVVEVDRLGVAQSRELVCALLARGGADDQAVKAIARESGGHPYFIYELVRYTQEVRDAGEPAAATPSLDDVIRARVGRLTETQRRFLQVVALAGRPLTQAVVKQAADCVDEGAHAVTLLRNVHLVRSPGARDSDLIEPYHDRIREAVIARIADDERSGFHRRIAVALQVSGASDPELLAAHFRAAGDTRAAAEHALLAAEAAAEALAFDRAAQLYQQVLEVDTTDKARRRDLHLRLGHALANAGRGADAAAAYLAAASAGTVAESLEHRRIAGLQYLRSGQVDEGLQTLHGVLESTRLGLARTPARALASLLWRRFLLRLRGLRFRRRDASQVTPETLSRIDVCWSAAIGLGMVDTFRGADLEALHLWRALRAGEPNRVARALAAEIAFVAVSGRRGRRRVEKTIARAAELVEQVADPYVEGWFWTCCGLAEHQVGHFREARERSERGIRVFRDRCTGVSWELSVAELCLTWALYYLGDLGELTRRVHALSDEAARRGDLFTVCNMRTGLPSTVWLAADRPHEARRLATGAMAQWSRGGFHLQHYWELLALAHCDLYEGDAEGAHRRVEERWRDLERSMLLRIQAVRIEAIHMRARAALAAARSPGSAPSLLGSVARAARRLERERMPCAQVFAQLLRAGVAESRGARDRARDLLREAQRVGGEADMRLFAAVARRREGGLEPGAAGEALVAEADRWMTQHGIANPARITDLFAPGFEP